MSWREIIIDHPCKISVTGNYLMLRGDTLQRIHLSEIGLLLISNTYVNITAVALVELVKYKVKLVFCDEKYNPYGEVVACNGCHNASKKIMQQISWSDASKNNVLTYIIHQKIINQARLLEKYKFNERANIIYDFAQTLELGDITNREGHSAKVYFNTLFGLNFCRDNLSDINSALNYGYSILLSLINREVVANGCLTQIGINHRNEYNQFNFSCDLIEPFRIIVDEFVYLNKDRVFDKNYKYDLVNLLNKEIVIDRKYSLMNAVKKSVKSVIDSLNSDNCQQLLLYEFC